MTDRQPTQDEEATLAQWCHELAQALDVPDLEVDIPAILGLAGQAAHTVLRPAAPLTSLVVGYAAGIAAGRGTADTPAALRTATEVALQLCRDRTVQAE